MNPNTATKTAVLVLSDPNGGDEALGRMFNALAAAYDFDQAGDEVRVQFQGAGTRWPELLESPEHPAYEVYQAVRHTIAGISCGCSDLFGGRDGATAAGLDLIKDNPLPGTSGVASVRALVDNGYAILAF
ncbi:hypothetical protein [Nocardia carnea]|uniref:hypothetical protein n=1 Tax=Nocardia carnea TaxID=37328 RepID=UPI0024574CAB|nr:hypothetical protein [Nocardia carnea]